MPWTIDKKTYREKPPQQDILTTLITVTNSTLGCSLELTISSDNNQFPSIHLKYKENTPHTLYYEYKKLNLLDFQPDDFSSFFTFSAKTYSHYKIKRIIDIFIGHHKLVNSEIHALLYSSCLGKDINPAQTSDDKDFFTTTKNTDTLLHLALRDCKDAEEISFFLEQLTPEISSRMATTTNNKGLIPIQLVTKSQKSDEEKDMLYKTLVSYTIPDSFKKMSDPIDFETIKKLYALIPNTNRYRYLELACTIINKTRKLFSESISHPQTNGMKIEEIVKKVKLFEQLNLKTDERRDVIIDKFQHDKDQETVHNMLLDNQIILFLLNKKANCQEQAYTAFKLIKEDDKNIPVGIYDAVNGDHVFTIIDPDGEQILCDTWLGTSCPGNSLLSVLKTHTALSNIDLAYFNELGEKVVQNLITSFNPNYHQIQAIKLFDTYPQPFNNTLELHQVNLPLKKLKPALPDNESLYVDLVEALKLSDLSVLYFLFTTTAGLKQLQNPDLRNKISNRCLNTIIFNEDQVPPILALFAMPEGRKMFYYCPDLRARATANSLNAYGKSGAYQGVSAFSMLIESESGRLLLDADESLRAKLSEESLNVPFRNGLTPVTYLVTSKTGRMLIDKHQDLRDKINEQGLNSIEEEGDNIGTTPLLYMMKTSLGCEVLNSCPDLIEKINASGLNSICQSDGSSVCFSLISTSFGRQLLCSHEKLRNLLSAESIFSVIVEDDHNEHTTGKCAADYLLEPEGKNLFSMLNQDLQQMIMEYKSRKLNIGNNPYALFTPNSENILKTTNNHNTLQFQ